VRPARNLVLPVGAVLDYQYLDADGSWKFMPRVAAPAPVPDPGANRTSAVVADPDMLFAAGASLIYWAVASCNVTGNITYPNLDVGNWWDTRLAVLTGGNRISFNSGPGRMGLAPETLNGRAVVRYTGGGTNWPWLAVSPLNGATECELWIVFRHFNRVNGGLWRTDFNGQNAFFTPGGITEWFGSTVQRNCGVPVVTLGSTYHTYRIQASNNHWANWIDGHLQAQFDTNTVPASDFSDTWFAAALATGEELYVAEIAVYNRNLTPGEAVALNSTLNERWGLDAQHPVASINDLIFEDSFEEAGTTTMWFDQDAPDTYSVTLATSPPPVQGAQVLRLERRNGEAAVGLQYPKFTGGEWPLVPGGNAIGNGPFGVGDVFKCGFGVYVPVEYPTDTATDLVFQILSTPDPTATTTPDPDFSLLRAPMLELAIVDGTTWRWRSRSDPNAYPGHNPDPTPVEQHTSAIERGKWTYWTVEWKGATDSTGYLRVRKAVDEGAYSQVVNYSGATAYNATYAGFLRLSADLE